MGFSFPEHGFESRWGYKKDRCDRNGLFFVRPQTEPRQVNERLLPFR